MYNYICIELDYIYIYMLLSGIKRIILKKRTLNFRMIRYMKKLITIPRQSSLIKLVSV